MMFDLKTPRKLVKKSWVSVSAGDVWISDKLFGGKTVRLSLKVEGCVSLGSLALCRSCESIPYLGSSIIIQSCIQTMCASPVRNHHAIRLSFLEIPVFHSIWGAEFLPDLSRFPES